MLTLRLRPLVQPGKAVVRPALVKAVPKPDWERCEQLKRDWSADHPGASAFEYENAMRRITAECGV